MINNNYLINKTYIIKFEFKIFKIKNKYKFKKSKKMQLHRNFSFNQKNISYTNPLNKNKNNENIIRLKNNFNNGNNKNNKINLNDSNDDITFYNYINTLKNQIFSPENGEDIYLYNYNKKMEKKIKYEDEKNNNYNLLTSKSVKNMNYKITTKNNKKTLILDLDETLVHSLFQPEKADNNIIKPDIYLKIFFNNKFQEIFVYKRPYLDIFLKEMRSIYNIYVFTASIEKYAKPLLDKLDKNNLILKKFYRESCLLSEGKFIKDLNSLNLNIKLKDVIIIDNNPFSYKFNKNNGIPIKSWHFDKSDTELIKIIPLLKYLAKTEDVRKYIPYIVKNDEINFEYINSIINSNNKNRNIMNENEKDSTILQKTQKTLYQAINYNNFNNNRNPERKNFIQNYHNPETINFREPQKNNPQKIQMKNFNNKNNSNTNNNVIYRNNFKRNGPLAINFNSGEINNNSIKNKSKNIDKFFKSYNNFYINSKYSSMINQEKENEKTIEANEPIKKHNIINNINLEQQKSFEDYQNIINLSNIYKSQTLKKKKKIPISKKGINKMKNKTSRILMDDKAFNTNIINKNKNLIRHCSSYKHFHEKEKNDINKIKPLIKTNNNYIILKKSNTLETAFDNFTNNINNINNPLLYNLPESKYTDKLIENNEYGSRKRRKEILFQKGNEIYNKNFCDNYVEKKDKVCLGKNNYIPKNKIKYKNILFRNKLQNHKVKSFSFSNFYREKFS